MGYIPPRPPPRRIEAPFSGEWRHNNGFLICGTLRIAQMDFDTDPSDLMKKETFDWIVQSLNSAQERELNGKPS